MRNKLKGIVCAGVLAMLCSQYASALGTSDAYYMAYDEFKIFNNTKKVTSTVSSYDSSELGGSVYCESVADDSDFAGVITKRDLNKVTGKAKWQVGFNAAMAGTGSTINLRSEGVNVITLEKRDGKMWVITKDGRVYLPSADGFYGIEAELEIDANTFTIQANGETVARNIEFLNPAKYIDCFWIETPKEGTGSFSVSHMRIHKNYSLNEWFLGTHSKVPDDWTLIGKGVSISSTLASDGHDKYSLYIEDSSFVSESGIGKDITYDSDELWLEYMFYVPKKVKDFGATLSANGKDIIKIGVNELEYGYWLGDEFKPLYEIRNELWNHAMIKLKKDGAEIYINHKLLAENVLVENVKIDNIRFTVGDIATGVGYIDEIMAKPIYPLPEDYVPEPVVPKKSSDTIVGIQSCNLWREGTHLGWDCLTAYDDRTPYLGYYDEGSIEVADWETKWLVEHGVDFELFCWYRQSHTKNTKIQRPLYSYGLHDGYMNSKYSKYLKFAIAWENGSGGFCDGIDDFRENIVPYWMEHYFKDDRYMLVDNKPVLAIYQINAMIRDFGTVEKVREALDYLEEECIKEGFDGVYILMQSVALNKNVLNQIKDIGADSVYAYNWGPNQADIEIQKTKMTEQSNLGIMDVVPIIGMGYDDIPWERTGGSYASPEKVSELISWVINEFQPTQTGLGNKMLLLDNWNEIAEGHFYYPSTLAGFDYLDAVRKVVTTNVSHEDAIPSEEAKERYTHIYVQDREIPQTFHARKTKRRQELGIDADSEFKTLKKYDFNDSESPDNYPIEKQIENLRIENGSLFATSTDVDPGFYIYDINIPTSNIRRFKVRLKISVPSSRFQIYYLTDNDGNWDESKTVWTDYSQSEGYVELSFDPTSGSKWYGTLTAFRIDPMFNAGDFEIESIEITGYDIDDVQPLSIDGVQQYPQRKIFCEDGLMYAPAAEYAGSLGYRWQKSFDGKYLQMMNESTGAYHEFLIGKDAKESDGELYFPLRKIVEEAGFKIIWDSKRNCANIITKEESDVDAIPDPEGTLNFNTAGDMCGLTSFNNMGNTKVLNGAFSFSASNNDPNMSLNPKMSADGHPYCNIRIKNKSQGEYFKVYFTTDSDTTVDEKKAVMVKISKEDKDYKCYSINMASNALWKGNVNSIRFDPTDGTGSMSIDYIIFSDKMITDINFGKDAVEGVNILVGGTMDKKELAYEKENMSAEYSEEESYIGRYSLKLENSSKGGVVKFPVAMTGGNKYSVTVWTKAPFVDSIKIGVYNSSGLISDRSVLVEDITNKWEKVTVHLPESEDGADGIYIKYQQGTVYLDQLHLWESKEDTEPALEEYIPKFKERISPKKGAIKVLIIGNSITQHDYADSMGWYGNWGMAATSQDKDYVHLLEAMAKEKNAKVEFKVKNVWDFERYFYDLGYIDASKYKDAVDFDADIIICAYGANINNADNESDDSFLSGRTFTEIGYQKIANYFNPYGDATIIAGVTPLVLPEIRGEIIEAAEKTGWAFVDMSDLTDDKYKAKPYKDAAVFGENVTGGVLGHPGDLGMQVMAERLWVELEKAMDSVKR